MLIKTLRIVGVLGLSISIASSVGTSLGQTPTNPDSVTDRAINFLLNSPDCILPCFWGLVPGTTTEQEAKNFLQENFPEAEQFDVRIRLPSRQSDPNSLNGYEFNLYVADEFYSLMVLTFEDEYLNHASIDFSFYEIAVWLPPNSLEPQYLLPLQDDIPDIYIGFYDTAVLGWSLFAIYDDFAMSYSFYFDEGQFTRYSDEPTELCPKIENLAAIKLYIQPASDNVPIDYYINIGAGAGWIKRSNGFKSVDFVTGLSAEEFVTHLRENPNECIEAFSYNYLKSHGQEF